ncbi:MAG TPA: alpha/beta hydrolase [Nannocystis sp.]
MSWAILIVGVTGVLSTLNAFFPVRTRWLAILGFFAGWLTMELTLHILVGTAVLLGVLIAYGGLQAWPGQLGLALAAASAGGLLGLYLRSRNARVTLREFYKSAELQVGPDAPRYPRSHIVFPFLAFHRRDIEVVRNIPFSQVAGQTLRLDVFRPKGPSKGLRRPAVLQIHGGAWVLGFKEYQGIPLLSHLATQGWVGFNIDYRLSPKASFPEHLIDCKQALAWIREHADEYGIDPDFIVVTGGSAGGHLAALVGLTAGDPEYQPGFESADTSVHAAVVFYGVFDLTNRLGTRIGGYRAMLERVVMKAKYDERPELFSRASPIDRVHPGAPTFCVIHGTRDTMTPVEDARYFVEKLRAVSSKPALYIEMQGAEHAFDTFPSIRTVPVIEAIERFLDSLYSAYCAGKGAAHGAARTIPAITDVASTSTPANAYPAAAP